MNIRIIKEIIGVALVVPPINDTSSNQITEINEISPKSLQVFGFYTSQ